MARANPVSYSVDEVRVAATGSSFSEIDHNEDSRVLSFGNQSGTRINVYYTTGTVGTCLNHPTKGKTQLFRGRVGLDLLERIFSDPRIHTGTGYYRKNNRQSWKTIRKDGREVFEVDSARRWKYVASVTGLSTSEEELSRIAQFCNLYDSLYWDRGAEPKMSQKRYSCGNSKIFTEMMFEIMHDLVDFPVKGSYTGPNKSTPHRYIMPGQEPCCQHVLVSFLDEHSEDVRELKRQLKSFRRDILIELVQWFFSRDHCGYSLTTDDDNELPISTSYTDDVFMAHFAYAELAYSKKNMGRMCQCHGVLWDDK